MIVEHMMSGRAISNHRQDTYQLESPFQELCNDTKTYKKNPLPEDEMNFTMSRCASKISFV